MHEIRHKPIRVLHVLGGTDCGGTEAWLDRVLHHIDRKHYQLDVCVHHERPGYFDESIKASHARIHRCTPVRPPWRYARSLRRVLQDYGPYDVIHSHVSYFSGWVLRVAHQAGVPIRIAHAHHATHKQDHRPSGITCRSILSVYRWMMNHWIGQHATHRLAASSAAKSSLCNAAPVSEYWRILRCGVDLTPFRCPPDRLNVRAELGIGPREYVLGHVGRMLPVKNQRLLLDVLQQLCVRSNDYRLLLVGDGPESATLKRYARERGVAKHVMFLGVRSDVPRMMKSAFDQFLFPSHHEGLGLVLIEAQAAGLPCVASTTIPTDATIVPQLVTRCRPDASPEDWAEAISQLRHSDAGVTREEAWRRVYDSDFEMHRSLQQLLKLYRDACRWCTAADRQTPPTRRVA